jgi:orotate phosphoribosyltransferase
LDPQKVQALKELIQAAITVDINGITLSSGITSHYYYDLKKVMLDPVGLSLLADLLYDEIALLDARSVGGLEIGAIPITTALLMKGSEEHKLKGFVVRKQSKNHGLKYMVEGELKSPVVMVDDVLTTGASLKKAIETVTDKGISVKHVFCILDRQMADNELEKSHIKFTSLFRHTDFKPYIDAEVERQLLIKKLVRNLAS